MIDEVISDIHEVINQLAVDPHEGVRYFYKYFWHVKPRVTAGKLFELVLYNSTGPIFNIADKYHISISGRLDEGKRPCEAFLVIQHSVGDKLGDSYAFKEAVTSIRRDLDHEALMLARCFEYE